MHTWTARRIAATVRRRKVPARDVAAAFLGRIRLHDPALRAFVPGGVDEAFTLAAAGRVDEIVRTGRDPGPLAGVPVAVKDNLCVRGLPATCASRMLAGWRPPADADAVARLLAAGAVPLGKTNLDEFGMGSSTEHSAFGPTRNPWDTSRVPGGSSGGSAAAVAACLAPIALGSDTGGSVRQPASFCGVVGATGTYGRVSRRGLVAFASSLDRVGVLARTSGDAALVLRVMSGGDEGDATSVRETPPDWEDAAGAGVRGLRIGVLQTGVACDPAVLACEDAALAALRDAGATTFAVRIPLAEHAVAVYCLVSQAEASSNLARFDGVRYGLRKPGDDVAAMTAATRAAGFGSEVKRRIVLGTFALSAGHAEQLHDRALRVRRLLAHAFAAEFARCDAIVCPVSPFPAFPLGEKTADPLAMWLCDVLSAPASLTGIPALSVPAGFAAGGAGDGLPVGLQVMAAPLREDVTFRVAGAIERAFGEPAIAEAFR